MIIITYKDFIGGILMNRKVREIMSKDIVAVLPSDSILEAAKQMEKHHVGSVPVVSAGEVKGILTDRDIILRCIAKEKDVNSTKASEIMSEKIVFVTPDQTVNDAAKIMANEQIRRLPVLNNGCIDGMISFADVTKLAKDSEISKSISEISKPEQ